ncbi:MAG TPA: OB-fold nucleic acid binding domain-containing protein [Burkholderiales bacterium]
MQDYAAVGLTLGRHPLALLRPALRRRRLSTAAELHGYRHGQLARTTGLVTHRQRPETAAGVVFITIEDETGHTNVVVWNSVAEAQRIDMLNAHLLTVYGHWETDGKVHHLIAGRLRDDSRLLGELETNSRDFR